MFDQVDIGVDWGSESFLHRSARRSPAPAGPGGSGATEGRVWEGMPSRRLEGASATDRASGEGRSAAQAEADPPCRQRGRERSPDGGGGE